MKKLLLVVAASLSLFSLSAVAGGGGNCLYGHDSGIASNAVKPGEEVIANEELIDPAVLALLKKQKQEKADAFPILTFN